MRSFLIKFIVFIIIPIIGILVLVLVKHKDIPAPKLTWSYSFNEKLFAFDNYQCDYLCIGSSIAQNNANSHVIVEGLSSQKYINFSSWGMRVLDIYEFIKVYLKKYQPKIVIFVTNTIDFENNSGYIESEQFKDRLYYPYSIINPAYYLINLDLHYYYKYYQLNKLYKSTDTIIQSLMFDQYGGVELNSREAISTTEEQWNHKLDFDNISQKDFDYLDTISRIFYEKDIKFVFVQSPIRGGLVNNNYWIHINKHKQKVRKILTKYDHLFIDEADHVWPDSLFFDYGHFRKQGAIIFTLNFIDKIKKNGLITDSKTAGK